MKNRLERIYRNRYFLLFVLLFAYVESVHDRIGGWQQVNAYTFTPEAAIFLFGKAMVLFVVMRYFIQKWQKSPLFNTSEMLMIFGASLCTHLVIMQSIGLLVAIVYDQFTEFDNVSRNFNAQILLRTTFSFFLDGIIYGSFYLAYHYHHKTRHHQLQEAKYHQALAESKIYQLKSQLNPHFLFNNLNVLDQLIEEDKHQASRYLHEFAEIYRYVLQASDRKTISIEDELAFARQYFGLIRHKYGEAYQLDIEGVCREGYLVPLTLQLLIENAVQHNLGTAAAPVHIRIVVHDQYIQTSNQVRPKRSHKPTHGRALANLREQYKLLTALPVEILHSADIFSVKIPMLHTQTT